jgi:hypothetical protein
MLDEIRGEGVSTEKVTTIEFVLIKLSEQITKAEKLVFGDVPGKANEQGATPQPKGKAMRYISIIKGMTQRLQEVNRQLESL